MYGVINCGVDGTEVLELDSWTFAGDGVFVWTACVAGATVG